MYFGQSKIGYTGISTVRAQFEGKDCYRMDSSMRTHIPAFDTQMDIQADSTIYVNDKNTPVFETFTMSSAGHDVNVRARFSATEIVAEVDAGGAKSSQTILIPPGTNLVGDTLFPSSNMAMKVGDKLVESMFDPLSLKIEEVRSDVLRVEPIEFDGSTRDAFVIRSSGTTMGDITCWQDDKGEVLKAVGPLGLTMIRETEETAKSLTGPNQSGTYVPPPDLAAAAAASVSSDIPNPRNVKYLKIRFSGISDKALVISDNLQKATLLGTGPYTVEYEISHANPDQTKAIAIPIADKNMAEFLEENAYVQSANPEITRLARQIVGRETNACKAASLLRAWVNENMRANGDVAILRSSLDILHTKTGVCRDYAILYTALARAAGIPTRVVSGLVYWKGKFYYHAWAESYMYKWLPVDATLPTDFVDATHIKFAQGDATTMFGVAKLMGMIKADVIQVK